MTAWSLIAGIAIGIAGTFVAWLIKTRLLPPRLRLSEMISRRDEGGEARWRVKLGNYSWQAAADLSIRAVLRARRPDGSIAILQLGLSTDDIDVLPARAKGKPGRHRLVYIDPAQLSPFGLERLPDRLRAKVEHPQQSGQLTLEDLLAMGSPSSLTITVTCSNGLSGARKWFSRSYSRDDITTASFYRGSLQSERQQQAGAVSSLPATATTPQSVPGSDPQSG